MPVPIICMSGFGNEPRRRRVNKKSNKREDSKKFGTVVRLEALSKILFQDSFWTAI